MQSEILKLSANGNVWDNQGKAFRIKSGHKDRENTKIKEVSRNYYNYEETEKQCQEKGNKKKGNRRDWDKETKRRKAIKKLKWLPMSKFEKEKKKSFGKLGGHPSSLLEEATIV